MRPKKIDSAREHIRILKNQFLYLLIDSRQKKREYSFRSFDYFRCIFVHIPRTGGVSICMSLFQNLAGGHSSIVDYQKIYSSRILKKYFKFSFVRNPYSRVLSAYNFLKKGGFNDNDTEWSEQHLRYCPNFKSFVMELLQEEIILNCIHFRPQVSFVYNANGKFEIDFLGRFESLAIDFEIIKKRISCSRKLLHLNSSTNLRDDLYTPEMKNKVYSVYKDDFESLGYPQF